MPMKGFADAAALESALALLHDAELMEFVQNISTTTSTARIS